MGYHITHRLSPLRGGFAVLAFAAMSLTLSHSVSAAQEGERPTMDIQTGAPYPILTPPEMAQRAAEPPRSRPAERIASARPDVAAPLVTAPPVALSPVAASPLSVPLVTAPAVTAPLAQSPRVVDLRTAPSTPIAPKRSFRMPWQIGVYQ